MGKETQVVVQPAEQQPIATPEVTTPIKPVDTSTHTATFPKPAGLPSENGTTPETVATDDKPAAEVKTMTQSEIDRIIAARLEQERKKYADYDAIKAELAALKQPAQTPAQEPNQRLTTLETTNQQLAQRNRELAIEAAVTKQASAIGLDAAAAAKLIDVASLTVSEDGTVTGAEVAVKAVAEKYPGLLAKQPQRAQPVNPGRGSDPTVRTDAQRRAEYFGGGGGGFWQGGGVVPNDNS